MQVTTSKPETLSGTSRIWIYQADRILNDQEISTINRKLEGLLSTWNTHGKPLTAEAWIEDRLFLILAVDEFRQYASGCSIDQSTHSIRMIGSRINVDFFNRMNFVYLDDENNPVLVSNRELPVLYERGIVTDETLFFNTILNKKSDWQEKKLIGLSESWHRRFL